MKQDKTSSRGSTLVLALFVISIIFLGGVGFISQASTQYKASSSTVLSAQALAVAEAGIQDVLTKLRYDFDFPPRSADDQVNFTYLQPFHNCDGIEIGSYQVSIDRSLMVTNQNLLVIRSIGRLGPADEPNAERTIQIEFDMNGGRSTYFQILSWTDLGGF